MLHVADNTGAKQLQVIRVLGGYKKRYAVLGDIVTCVIKIAAPHGEGIRVIFMYHGEFPSDVFEFDSHDVYEVMLMINNFSTPEGLMVAIRNKSELTVH